MEQNNPNHILQFYKEHSVAIYFALTGILIAVLLIYIFKTFVPVSQNRTQPSISPTPFKFGNETNGNLALSPLQKTEIGKTTNKDIESNNKVISKEVRGNQTIYKVESKIPMTPDEIRTKDGIVTFERTSTKTDTAAPLQNISEYEALFGKPEVIIDRVGPLGWENSAYLYPNKGFILYANRYTKSVYEVQRFKPMSLTEYRNLYGSEFLSPAPSPAAEGISQ